MHSQTLILFAVYLAYAVLGGVLLRLWLRRRRRPRPASLYTAPDTWIAYWLPVLIAVQVWALISGELMSLALFIISPSLFGVDWANYKVGFVSSIALIAVWSVAIDVLMVVRARQASRQQQTATQDSHADTHDGSPSH